MLDLTKKQDTDKACSPVQIHRLVGGGAVVETNEKSCSQQDTARC